MLSPQHHHENVIDVMIDVNFLRLVDVNEELQNIQVFLHIEQWWTNPHLTWNPADYGGLEVLILPSDKLWQPDTVILNSILPDGKINPPLSYIKTYTRLFHNGSCYWNSHLVIDNDCNINLKRFPYDKHQCTIQITSRYHDIRQLRYDFPQHEESDDINLVNKEWVLTVKNVIEKNVTLQCCDYPVSSIILPLQIKRKSLAYFVNLFIPCIILSILMVLAFVIPPSSGDRHNHSLTILFTVIVFQQLTMDTLPPYAFPYLSELYFLTTILAFVSLLITTLTINLYYRKGRTIPRFLHVIILDWIGAVVYMTKKRYNYATGKHDLDHMTIRCSFDTAAHNTCKETEDGESIVIDMAPYNHFSFKSHAFVDKSNRDFLHIRNADKDEAIKNIAEKKDGLSKEENLEEAREEIESFEVKAVVRTIDRLFFCTYIIVVSGYLLGTGYSFWF